MREMVKALRPILGTVAACRHVGISRASYYRSQRAAPQQPTVVGSSPGGDSCDTERKAVCG